MRKLVSTILLLALAPGAAHAAGSFRAVDVHLDTGKAHLGVYQIELTYDRARVTIVGLEGGDTVAFKKAPYYDRRGLTAGRIKVAAFIPRSVKSKDAPAGRTRVARLHLHIGADDAEAVIASMKVRLVVAADPDARLLEARAELTALPRARKEEAGNE